MPNSLLVCMPRKMFPPPTTRATCTPRAATSRISAERPARTFSSMPYSCRPIRASPDSLSRIRRYDGFATEPPGGAGKSRSPLPELFRHLGCQVVRPLLEPLADLEPDEAPHGDLRARGLPGLREQLPHLPVRVLDERLLHEAEVGEIFLQLPLGDLVQDLVGLPGRPRLVAVDGLLVLHHLRRHVLPADVGRVGRRHLHRQVLCQRRRPRVPR